jgi:hypothetical protein
MMCSLWRLTADQAAYCESPPAAAKGSVLPLGCLTHIPRGIGFVDKLFRPILK